jgi:hypothetical protein
VAAPPPSTPHVEAVARQAAASPRAQEPLSLRLADPARTLARPSRQPCPGGGRRSRWRRGGGCGGGCVRRRLPYVEPWLGCVGAAWGAAAGAVYGGIAAGAADQDNQVLDVWGEWTLSCLHTLRHSSER